MAGLLGYMAQNPQAQMAQDVAAYGGLSSYQPTLRDRVGGWLMDRGLPGSTVQGLVGSRGNAGAGGMGLLDFIPGANVPFAVDEYMRADPTNGDKAMAAIGILPGGKAAKPVVKEGAQAARGLMDAAAQRGDEILGLLKAGRGSEVTDAMLDMGDPVQNTRLGDHLYRNYDLPMDEASRQARASEFDTNAFHADFTGSDIQSFRPGKWNSTYFAATPNRAEVAGAAGRNELAHLYDSGGGTSNTAILPVRMQGDQIATLRPSRAAWDALPQKTSMPPDRPAGAGAWWDAYDEKEIRPPEFDADGWSVPGTGEYTYVKQPYPSQQYHADVRSWRASVRHLPSYGSDDAASLRRLSADQSGFLVNDEAGASIVADANRMPIRSRFARFDPRLAHLRNLSAGVTGVAGGAGLLGGLLADPQQAQAQGLAGYMTGGGI